MCAVRHGFEVVAADQIQQLETAFVTGVERVRGVEAGAPRNWMTPCGLEARTSFVADVLPTWQLHCVRTAFCGALDAGVASDRHDAALGAADHAARERE